MVYIVGIIGLIGGFVFGQMVLYFFLRNKSRQDLLNDNTLKWQYGTLNWLIAGLSCYAFIKTYLFYFPH